MKIKIKIKMKIKYKKNATQNKNQVTHACSPSTQMILWVHMHPHAPTARTPMAFDCISIEATFHLTSLSKLPKEEFNAHFGKLFHSRTKNKK